MPAIGKPTLTTTVRASGASTDATGEFGDSELKNSPRETPVALNFSALNTTSWALSIRPLVGGRGSSFRLERSLKVKGRPSGDISHDSAPSGSCGGDRAAPRDPVPQSPGPVACHLALQVSRCVPAW